MGPFYYTTPTVRDIMNRGPDNTPTTEVHWTNSRPGAPPCHLYYKVSHVTCHTALCPTESPHIPSDGGWGWEQEQETALNSLLRQLFPTPAVPILKQKTGKYTGTSQVPGVTS